jgi:hypothetical protein
MPNTRSCTRRDTEEVPVASPDPGVTSPLSAKAARMRQSRPQETMEDLHSGHHGRRRASSGGYLRYAASLGGILGEPDESRSFEWLLERSKNSSLSEARRGVAGAHCVRLCVPVPAERRHDPVTRHKTNRHSKLLTQDCWREMRTLPRKRDARDEQPPTTPLLIAHLTGRSNKRTRSRSPAGILQI